MAERKLAIIDMGSNSIRLVIYTIKSNGCYHELHNFKVVARLSSHTKEDGSISDKGIEIIVETLSRFNEIIKAHQIDQIKGVATAALRLAPNQTEVINIIKKKTALSFTVLSDYEEAYYGYLAVTNSTNIEDGISVDIGGGSTEVTLFKNRKLLKYVSFPFGAITLKNRFIESDPPTLEEMNNLQQFLINQFSSLNWIVNTELPVVGIGGTARNLCLMHQRKINYPLPGLHQYELQPNDIQEVQQSLVERPFSERQNIQGLSKDRTDIIIPAIQAIASLIKVTNAPQFIMSNKGLRDGIFYEEVLQQIGIDQFPNVADESFFQLSYNYQIDNEHVKQVSKLASAIYKELSPYLLEKYNDEENMQLLRYSARVLYMGEYISNEASSQHTFYLLSNKTIDGLSHSQRLAIALISSFKSKSYLLQFATPYSELLSKQQLKRYELLGAILKLAYSLNRTRRNVIYKCFVTKPSKRNIQLQLLCNNDYFFEEEQAQKYKKHIEKRLNFNFELHFQNNN
ncbi:Ppx/GppA phosphatase family protein [Alkalihalobacterium elongatum]|uniref:Ppx/GppA phosphatase family protein n=1 Tax=Alkalihalobacterium elongatum TaxID=2675466 RepID=UPI001C1FC408|nr:Ppx/GppA phosphatase family protein [Alkalihalobacterium elongatum]